MPYMKKALRFSIFTVYKILDNNIYTCDRIRTTSECEAAALQTGLTDITVENDNQNGVTYDPPYCYFEGGSLKFNINGTNTGSCTPTDKCLCIAVTCAARNTYDDL